MDDDEKEVAIFTYKENCYETEMHDFNQNMKYEEYGQYYNAEEEEEGEEVAEEKVPKSDIEYKLNLKYKEELAKQEGKMGVDNTKK